jgi:hypothetical protein
MIQLVDPHGSSPCNSFVVSNNFTRFEPVDQPFFTKLSGS